MKTPDQIARERENQKRYRDRHREELRAKWRKDVQEKKASMSPEELAAAKQTKSDYDKEYRAANRERIRAEKAAYYATPEGKELRRRSSERLHRRRGMKPRAKLPADELRRRGTESKKKWLAKNPGFLKAAYHRRMDEDPGFRMMKAIRARVRHFFVGRRKSARTQALVGCTPEELRKYIEGLWKPNMDWTNYGRDGWHLDHVIPCALFDLTDPEQQRKCFHYTNMAPLWQIDNLIKSDTLPRGMAHPNPPAQSPLDNPSIAPSLSPA